MGKKEKNDDYASGQIGVLNNMVQELNEEEALIGDVKYKLERLLIELKNRLEPWKDQQRAYEHNTYLREVVKENKFEGRTVEYLKTSLNEGYAEMNEYYGKARKMESDLAAQINLIEMRLKVIKNQRTTAILEMHKLLPELTEE